LAVDQDGAAAVAILELLLHGLLGVMWNSPHCDGASTLTIRGLVEQATKSWSFRRHLPSQFRKVPIIVSPSAGLKYLFKPMTKLDPPLLRNVQELVRPGDVVWDVGANIGLFSFAAAALSGSGGTVVAFEPDAWLVQLLRRSRSIQPPQSAQVIIVPVAVASDVALRSFHVARRSRASNSLAEYGHTQAGGYSEEYTVPAFNLDWLLGTLRPPNVIKCDVEGAEVEVFRNQLKMLSEIRPVIVCEVGSETSPTITSVFLEAEYRLYDGEKSLAEGASEIRQASWSTIAIPEERKTQFSL